MYLISIRCGRETPISSALHAWAKLPSAGWRPITAVLCWNATARRTYIYTAVPHRVTFLCCATR